MQEGRQSGLTPTEIVDGSDSESVVQEGVEAADVAAQAGDVGGPLHPVERAILAYLHAVGGGRQVAGRHGDTGSVPGQVNGGGVDAEHVGLLNVHPGRHWGSTEGR